MSVVEWPAMNITNRCWKSNAIVADIADYRIVRFSILVLINSCISLLYYYFFPCTSKYILVYDIFCCMVFKKKKLERIDMVFIVVVIESALLNKTILFKEIMIWCLFQFIVGCKMKKKRNVLNFPIIIIMGYAHPIISAYRLWFNFRLPNTYTSTSTYMWEESHVFL